MDHNDLMSLATRAVINLKKVSFCITTLGLRGDTLGVGGK